MSEIEPDGSRDRVVRGDRLPAVWDEYAEALPGVARLAGHTAARAGAWTLASGLRSGRLLARAVTDPATAGELVQTVASDVAEATRAISEVARKIGDGEPLSAALRDGSLALGAVVLPADPVPSPAREKTLRERGEDLLHRSRDVWSEDEAHPAFARILDDLAPDEARILLLLLRGGPQPSVDVRTGGPAGMVASTLVAGGLQMIGPRAGCRHVEEVPTYLDNLHRLGLVWFSREQLKDPLEYQVVEAQPDVLAAMHEVRFPKVVRRSIQLTPFGTSFCAAALVEDDAQDGAEGGAEDRPSHAVPSEPER